MYRRYHGLRMQEIDFQIINNGEQSPWNCFLHIAITIFRYRQVQYFTANFHRNFKQTPPHRHKSEIFQRQLIYIHLELKASLHYTHQT